MFGVQSNPAEIPSDHPIVAATTEAIATETGTTPTLYPAHVASDIRFPIRCLNAATVGFGALAGNFYGPNEWVDAADMHRATRVIVRIVSAWADQAITVHPLASGGNLSRDYPLADRFDVHQSVINIDSSGSLFIVHSLTYYSIV